MPLLFDFFKSTKQGRKFRKRMEIIYNLKSYNENDTPKNNQHMAYFLSLLKQDVEE